MNTLLLIEDDHRLAHMVSEYLEKSGFSVQHAATGLSGLNALQDVAPAMVLLDLMLPDIDGLEVCKRIRALPGALAQTPVLMLTAKGDPMDRIVGLELGADDYIAKPYNPRELLARIKAVHRRMQLSGGAEKARYLCFSGFTMDLVERMLTDVQGTEVLLTSMDFNSLKFFAEHAGETLDRSQLMEQTRGRDLGPFDRSLDVQVSRLRQRLNDDGKQPALIKTVRGSGYVFSTDVTKLDESPLGGA